MKATEYLGGYLKKEQIAEPIKVTVKGTVAEEIEGVEKLVVYFDELKGGLVLNKTNIRTLIEEFGTDETSDWNGKDIVLWNDMNVQFQGKRGGLRLRAVHQPPQDVPF